MTSPRDIFGRDFDPARHLSKKDGAPLINRAGAFMPRGGRKPKPKPAASDPAAPAATVPPPPASVEKPAEVKQAAPDFTAIKNLFESPPPAQTGNFKNDLAAVSANPTAESVIGIIQTALILLGGSDGALDDTEKAILRPPLVRVLKKYEIGAEIMPAEIDLALAILAIFASKLQRPKFATRWEAIKAWCLGKVFAVKGARLSGELRREAPEVLPAVPANTPPPAPGPEAAAAYLAKHAENQFTPHHD